MRSQCDRSKKLYPSYLLEILRKGTEKARIKAEENLKNIREKVGLI